MPGGKIALVENHCSRVVLSELSRVMEMFYICNMTWPPPHAATERFKRGQCD